ncbi:MAG: hypothetical protein ACI4RO_00245, partial [Candidatus Scatosoma sp.]
VNVINYESSCLTVWSENLSLMINANSEADVLKEYNNAVELMKKRHLNDVIDFYAEAYEAGKNAAGVDKGWIAYRDGYVSPTLKNADGTYSDKKIGANGDNYYLITKK